MHLAPHLPPFESQVPHQHLIDLRQFELECVTTTNESTSNELEKKNWCFASSMCIIRNINETNKSFFTKQISKVGSNPKYVSAFCLTTFFFPSISNLTC
jgi:hypothetical protein